MADPFLLAELELLDLPGGGARKLVNELDLKLVKAVEPGPFDWSKIVDDSYLPDVLKRKPKS